MTELAETTPKRPAIGIIRGAEALCEVVYGEVSPSAQRRLYRDRAAGRLPSLFKMGQTICGHRDEIEADVKQMVAKARAEAEAVAAAVAEAQAQAKASKPPNPNDRRRRGARGRKPKNR
jgi:hypothetical protein